MIVALESRRQELQNVFQTYGTSSHQKLSTLVALQRVQVATILRQADVLGWCSFKFLTHILFSVFLSNFFAVEENEIQCNSNKQKDLWKKHVKITNIYV